VLVYRAHPKGKQLLSLTGGKYLLTGSFIQILTNKKQKKTGMKDVKHLLNIQKLRKTAKRVENQWM